VALERITRRLTIRELSEDPTDLVARAIRSVGYHLASARGLIVWYLIIHGVIKIILVYLLLTRQVRVYPWAVVFLLVFGLAQSWQGFMHSRPDFIVFGMFDLVLAAGVWIEYRRLRHSV